MYYRSMLPGKSSPTIAIWSKNGQSVWRFHSNDLEEWNEREDSKDGWQWDRVQRGDIWGKVWKSAILDHTWSYWLRATRKHALARSEKSEEKTPQGPSNGAIRFYNAQFNEPNPLSSRLFEGWDWLLPGLDSVPSHRGFANVIPNLS